MVRAGEKVHHSKSPIGAGIIQFHHQERKMLKNIQTIGDFVKKGGKRQAEPISPQGSMAVIEGITKA